MRSSFVSPPIVHLHVPFQTLRMDPVWDFLVTRLGLRVRMAFLAEDLGARGLVALAALGAFGLRALRAALRVTRLVTLAAFLAALGLVARRTAVLGAILD